MSVLHSTVASYDATDKLKVELTNTSEPRRRASLSVLFFISGHFRCGASVEQGLPSFWISMSEKWLKSRAKQSTGEDIASLFSLQNPTALLVEEEDGVLFEPRLMPTCSGVHRILFGVEHYEQTWSKIRSSLESY